MYVCICKAVSDKTVYRAIDEGTDSLRLLRERTGAGTCCGRCIPELRAMLAARSADRESGLAIAATGCPAAA